MTGPLSRKTLQATFNYISGTGTGLGGHTHTHTSGIAIISEEKRQSLYRTGSTVQPF